VANSYAITSMSHQTAAAGDFLWTITGTVNGTAVSVAVWNTVLQPNLATAIGFQNFMTPLLLAAFNNLTPQAQAPPLISWVI
jgi:hypothetical protein